MKRNLIIAIVGTLFLVVGLASVGMCEDTNDVNSALVYGAFVDNYIQKCEAKAVMLDSSSLHIRKSALRATVKGAFIQANRTRIVNQLVQEKAPMNTANIEYHLNQMYADSVDFHDVYASLSKFGVKR